MSGRVCPDEGPCEEPGGPLPGWVMSRLTGPSRPSEITLVELLLPEGVPRTPPRESSDSEERDRQRRGVH